MRAVRYPQALAKPLLSLLVIGLLVFLTACPRPLTLGSPPPTSLDAAVEAVAGQVDFGGRTVQADIKDDIAPGATISLIEVQSGQTMSTTRTDAAGKFVLTFSNGFKPVPLLFCLVFLLPAAL